MGECGAVRASAMALLTIAAALSLGGCQTLSAYSGYAAKPLELKPDQKTAYERIVEALQVRTPGIKPCFAEQYRPGNSAADTCQAQRNHVVSNLMSESVSLCVVHLSEIYGSEAGFNIATGSIAALASGAASVSAGTKAKTLAALSTFASAERALVNESVYKNLLTTAIATKIEQSRATLGKALLAKKSQAYAGYRIEDAIYDVIDYHHACSFYKGMELALAEGTNTNPASRLASLETKARALAQEIDTRAAALKLDDATRKGLIDSKGAVTTGDPVLRSLVQQYQAVQQEILTGTQSQPTAPKPGAATAATVSATLESAQEAAANPLAGLAEADAKVTAAAEGMAESVKKQAADSGKTLPSTYLDAVGQAAKTFAKNFHDELLGDKKPGHPVTGSIATLMKAYHSAQSDYVIKGSALDLKTLRGQQDKVDLAGAVSKAGLALNDQLRQVGKCEAVALRRIEDFRKAQIATFADKKDDEIAKLSKIAGTAPAWTGADTTACMK